MATKTKNTASKFFTIENAIDTVSLVNTVALTSTEKAFTKGFDIVGEIQTKTEKLLKKGFKFSAKKHDEMFDMLDASKEKTVKTFNKVSKKFNKKSA